MKANDKLSTRDLHENEEITKRDLREFEQRLISILTEIRLGRKSPKYLRSRDVCEMFNISQSTLQNFRNSDVIPFKRIGGTLIYEAHEVEAKLQGLSDSGQ